MLRVQNTSHVGLKSLFYIHLTAVNIFCPFIVMEPKLETYEAYN